MKETTIKISAAIATCAIVAIIVSLRTFEMQSLQRRIAILESTSASIVDRMDRNQLYKGDCIIATAPPDIDPEVFTPSIVVKTDYPIENTYCYNYCLDDGKGPRACRNECKDTPEIYTRIGRDEALRLLFDASGLKYRAETEEVTEAVLAKLVK